jgi:hypothetical protein
MLRKLSTLLVVSTVTLLAACSDAPPTDTSAAVSAVAATDVPAARTIELPTQYVPATPAPRVLVAAVNVLHAPAQVSESERVAEELRLVDYEQSYSLEMNRRHQEQAERAQRATIAARAGVVQGPGCEGTEGNAAVECEQSLI